MTNRIDWNDPKEQTLTTLDYESRGIELDLLLAARDDQKAVNEAKATGAPIPATPNLDEYHRRYNEMATATKTKATKGERTKGRADIRYFHDGRSMSESHKHKLSTVAYFYSFDLDGNKPRVGTSEFIAALKKAGIADPGAPGWMVKLPNGVTIECRKDGERSQFKGEPVARAKATTNGAAKKATTPVAKKSTAKTSPGPKSLTSLLGGTGGSKVGKSARAAAVKAANPPKASKQVTPIPKKQTAKRAAPKKSAARKSA